MVVSEAVTVRNSLQACLLSHEYEVPFTLIEKSDVGDSVINGSLVVESIGLSFRLEGFSERSVSGSGGFPLFVELYEGSVNVRAYGDINSDEPTHSFSLNGAKNSRYKDED